MVGVEGPHKLLEGGKVACSVLLLLEVGQAYVVVVPPIFVKRTVPVADITINSVYDFKVYRPLGVSKVPRGLADGAGEGPEHRAGHQPGVVLQ